MGGHAPKTVNIHCRSVHYFTWVTWNEQFIDFRYVWATSKGAHRKRHPTWHSHGIHASNTRATRERAREPISTAKTPLSPSLRWWRAYNPWLCHGRSMFNPSLGCLCKDGTIFFQNLCLCCSCYVGLVLQSKVWFLIHDFASIQVSRDFLLTYCRILNKSSVTPHSQFSLTPAITLSQL